MAPKKGVSNKLVAKLVTVNTLPCAFCRRKIDDEVAFGKLYEIGHIQCHYFCVLLSSCLIQKGRDEDGLFGFLYEDILAEVERSKKHKCSFCGAGGATLGCAVLQCKKQFHLPCGRERHTVSLFYGNYKSFCQLHAPKQIIPASLLARAKLRMAGGKKRAGIKPVDSKNLKELCSGGDKTEDESEVSDMESVCVICYEPVEGYPTTQTFWPPCCARDAWFHRSCLERMSLSAGMHYLKCPLCNDKLSFYEAVVKQGYYVPDRDAAWELEQNAFSEIYERPVACGVGACLCPQGRGHDEDQGAWDIKLCLLCGSTGAHAQCLQSETPVTENVFVCHICRPAAPADLETLASSIEAVILSEEQSRAATRVQHGPRMPSRMSLRRTKGALSIASSSSQSAYTTTKTEIQSDVASPNIISGREDLNLKTPKRPTAPLNSPRNSLVLKLAPNKSPFKHTASPYNHMTSPLKHVISPYKHTVSPFKYMKSPLKSIENTSPTKLLDESLFSPRKLLEESLRRNGRSNMVISEEIVERLRRKFRRPKPMSKKKKIISDILNDLFNEVTREHGVDSKSEDAVQILCSPRKEIDVKQELEEIDAQTSQDQSSSPTQPKPETEPVDISDSSTDTFELPPEFIAESSNDEYPTRPTQNKLKTVDMQKDSSLEISENDQVINIDVVKMADTSQNGGDDKMADMSKGEFLKNLNLKSPLKSKKCAFKFSPYNKEVLQDDNVDIDLESFKNRYLNEVAPETPKAAETVVENETRKRLRRRKRKRDGKIVLQYESKTKKVRSKRDLSIRNKDIKVKIKWRNERLKLKITDSKRKKKRKTDTEERKNKKRDTEMKKNKNFTQYILNYSQNDNSKIVKPEQDVTPAKRRYIKQEKSPDYLVQTSLDRFFKVKPTKE